MLITDDIKFCRHLHGKIETQFSTYFLTALITPGYLSKEKSLGKLEQLKDIRNWRNNIIYQVSKNELEQINS